MLNEREIASGRDLSRGLRSWSVIGNLIDIYSPMHVPQQQVGVEVLGPDIVVDPFLPPVAESLNYIE